MTERSVTTDVVPSALAGGSAFHACLLTMLAALRWGGTKRHLQGAMPPPGTLNSLLDLRTVLFRLGFTSRPYSAPLARLSSIDLPCLFVPAFIPNECWIVLKRRESGALRVYSGRGNQIHDVNPDGQDGQLFVVKRIDPTEQTARSQSWVRHAISEEGGTVAKLFLVTFAINLLAIVLSIYTIAVYDKAVAAHSNMTLGFLFAGVLLSLALEFTLREARARGLAYFGARMESLITLSALQRILHMPASAVEQSPLSSQISRLKMFETVRDAFSGPVASTLLDLPFIVFFIIVVFTVGGNAGWIVVGFAVLMALLVVVYGPIARFRTQRLTQANTERRKFLGELTQHLETIRNCRVEDIWLQRHHELSVTQLRAQINLQRLNFTEHTLAHILFLLAGTAMTFYSAIQVMSGSMTSGALVAVMALAWRVLSPVQTLFLHFGKISQTSDIIRQIDQIMRLPVEYEPDKYSLLPRKFTGRLTAEGVVFRYASSPEPTLRGATLEIAKGECVALAGGSGSGKSTLLKLFAGLYPIQAGGVYLDGLDLRQIDGRDLRQNLGYLEEKHHVFSGTLAENMRLSNPEIGERNMLQALIEFQVLPRDATRRDLDTPIAALTSDSLLRRFALARVFIKEVPVYLLDEPSLYLDAEADSLLRQKIEALKGRATIVMATVQPAYMRLASRVILMQSGRVWTQGPPEATIPLLMQQPRQAGAEMRAPLPDPRLQMKRASQ